MAIKKIKCYKQVDGKKIIKVFFEPSITYPHGGWCYLNEYFEEILRDKQWYINQGEYICSCSNNNLLHQEIMFLSSGIYPELVDHVSGIRFDNILDNLNSVTVQQNSRNRRKCGYIINEYEETASFSVGCSVSGKFIHRGVTKTEDVACISQYEIETQAYLDYNYDFFKDRRDDLHLVDLERTGKISSEAATFRHVMKYARYNAWFVWRYNLFDYFKQYKIPIPQYSLNEKGRMIDIETGELLCPFDIFKETKNFH